MGMMDKWGTGLSGKGLSGARAPPTCPREVKDRWKVATPSKSVRSDAPKSSLKSSPPSTSGCGDVGTCSRCRSAMATWQCPMMATTVWMAALSKPHGRLGWLKEKIQTNVANLVFEDVNPSH